MNESHFNKLKQIRALVLDVDGVLTDGGLYMNNSEMGRKMNIKDGFAIKEFLSFGYPIFIISGSGSDSIKTRLTGLGIKEVHLYQKNKLDCFKHLSNKYKLNEKHVAFIGDDIPDLELMKLVGFKACPADACKEIRQIADYTSLYKGGEGCFREIIEFILKLQGAWNY